MHVRGNSLCEFMYDLLSVFIAIQTRATFFRMGKAHMRFRITLLCDYLVLFPRYNDFLVENLRLRRFTHILQIRLKPSQGGSLGPRVLDCWSKKN